MIILDRLFTVVVIVCCYLEIQHEIAHIKLFLRLFQPKVVQQLVGLYGELLSQPSELFLEVIFVVLEEWEKG